jgi:hypothetical protein
MVRRNDVQTADPKRTRAENPDRTRVASGRRRDLKIVDIKHARRVFGRDGVGQQSRHLSVRQQLDVERTKLDEPIERMLAVVVEVDSVWHVPLRIARPTKLAMYSTWLNKSPTSHEADPSNIIMHGDRNGLAVATAAIVLSVASIPALAQSNAVRWRTATPELTAALWSNGVGVYTEPHAASAAVDVPPNLHVPSGHRTTIVQMLERSPMFRRQCLRLAGAPQLSVVVRTLHPLTGGPRARTQITLEENNRLLAAVEINPLGDFTELLAHELEHIIEQLDGIDLQARASVARSGVWSCVDGTFETSRAVRVGTLVATEVRRGR